MERATAILGIVGALVAIVAALVAIASDSFELAEHLRPDVGKIAPSEAQIVAGVTTSPEKEIEKSRQTDPIDGHSRQADSRSSMSAGGTSTLVAPDALPKSQEYKVKIAFYGDLAGDSTRRCIESAIASRIGAVGPSVVSVCGDATQQLVGSADLTVRASTMTTLADGVLCSTMISYEWLGGAGLVRGVIPYSDTREGQRDVDEACRRSAQKGAERLVAQAQIAGG